MDLNEPSTFNITAATSQGNQTVVPQVIDNVVTTLLGPGATATIDINLQTSPILDVYCFADQALSVQLFERIAGTDTYRAVGAAVPVVANTATEVISNKRVAASQARIVITNTSGVALTVHSSEVLARSL